MTWKCRPHLADYLIRLQYFILTRWNKPCQHVRAKSIGKNDVSYVLSIVPFLARIKSAHFNEDLTV